LQDNETSEFEKMLADLMLGLVGLLGSWYIQLAIFLYVACYIIEVVLGKYQRFDASIDLA